MGVFVVVPLNFMCAEEDIPAELQFVARVAEAGWSGDKGNGNGVE